MVNTKSIPSCPRTVSVLAGGASAERDVSLRSGAAVAAALRVGGHRVIEVDPAERNIASIRWDAVECPLEWSDGRFSTAAVTSHPLPVTRVDVVFLALHGAFGEDGGVQEILDSHGIPYTGSGAVASRIAFSKTAAKQAFIAQGVLTPRFVGIHFSDDEVRLHAAAEAIGYPLVVKPDRQGSSIGVTIVETPDRLLDATRECFRFDSVGLMESAIIGSEWTVGVIDDNPLPPIRIETSRSFFDFSAKYDDDTTRYEFDGDSPALRRIAEIGCDACRAVGTQGIARVDLRIDAVGNPFVLEVNTIPGMTDHSLVPKAAARCGMSMTDLCERAIDSAFRSHHQRQNAQPQRDRHSSGVRRRAG